MDKVAVASTAKPKAQKTNAEISQGVEERIQETDNNLVFNLNYQQYRADGRGFDLSRIPVERGSGTRLPNEETLDNKADLVNEQDEGKQEAVVQESKEPAKPDEPAGESSSARAVIVSDLVVDLAEGQIRKTTFLEKLRTEISRIIEPILSSVGQTTEGCPYLNYWLGLYQEKEAAHIERTARKYAPDVTNAKTAEEYISIIAQRALSAAEIWSKTGKITGVPDGVPLTLPNEVSFPGECHKAAGNTIQFKAREGGASRPDDTGAIQKELGDGQPLSPDVRSRMESAFGKSFSKVRTHTDATANRLSEESNAHAFTVGNHVAFGMGEYHPGTIIGDALIAHELAHTIQQDKQENTIGNPGTTAGYDALELDADMDAARALKSLWGSGKGIFPDIVQKTTGALRSGLQLQRCSKKTKAATSIKAIPQAPGADLLNDMNLHGAPSSAQPLKLPFGGYLEFIRWETDGRNGMIVQEINSTLNTNSCHGGSTRGESRPDPKYWEMWNVDDDGHVTPSPGGVNDAWVRAGHRDTSGNFTIDAKVFWVEALDITANFRSYNPNVPTVPNLKTTPTQPNNLTNSLLDRYAAGSWACNGVTS